MQKRKSAACTRCCLCIKDDIAYEILIRLKIHQTQPILTFCWRFGLY